MLSGYFSTVITVCVFITVALGLSHPRFKGAVGFGAGILVICVVLLPLVDIFRDFDINEPLDGIIADMKQEGAADDAIELAFERGIAEYIAAEHDVDVGCVVVNADGFDMESLTAERIYVTLSGEAIYLDYKKIQNEISGRFTQGGECEVSLSVG